MIKLKDLLEKKFSDKEIKMAFGILNDPRYKGGNYSGAVKAIEKLKRGLSKHPSVKNALRRANEEVVLGEAGMGDKIGKLFKTKDKKEIDGIANLMNMTSVKVLQSMQKQNPKGFKRMVAKMGELPAMEEVQEEVEEQINEEVANITVDPKNRISKPADQNKHSNEIVKQARRFGLKASQMGKHVRIKGSKKAVNDFLRIVIGKSSYGDPTEKDTSTPQIDKMLNKGLKEEVEMISENVIEKMKQIVAKKQAMKIDGVMVDMFTASAVTQIYDKVNDANKKKMEKMKPVQLANAAMKLMRRQSVDESVIMEDGHNDVESMKNKVKTAMSALQKMNTELGKLGDEDSLPTWWTNKVAVAVDKLDGMADYIDTQVEAVSPAQQAAIAISKKERGEKPKNEGNRPTPYQVNVRGKGGVAVKAKDMDDAKEKAFKELGIDSKLLKDKSFMRKVKVSSKYNEVKENRARRDAMRGISRDKDFARKDDEDIRATDDDRKAADKNPIIQLRRIADLPRGGEMEFKDGKKKKISQADAKMALKGFAVMRKPQDKQNFAKNAGASHTSLKKILQIVGRKR